MAATALEEAARVGHDLVDLVGGGLADCQGWAAAAITMAVLLTVVLAVAMGRLWHDCQLPPENPPPFWLDRYVKS